MKAVLVLEDGTLFPGESFGLLEETTGEVVFNTCMTGYQEILTDPSYNGQIVNMTYPLIGNYGFNEEDTESYRPHAQGLVVKELCAVPSNWRCLMTPEEYCKKHKITGIKGVDTRSLTQHIRSQGSMSGIISSETDRAELLMEKLNLVRSKKRNLVAEVSVKTAEHHEGSGKRVAVMDYGVKYNILRSLRERDCDVYIFSYNSSFDEVMSVKPDGILLSNGPGDPKDLPGQVETVKKMLGVKPILGICLGHQLLGLSLGGNTYKLKFGHHGGNHPVKDLITGKCCMTSQNHNYALEPGFSNNITITHLNVNDKTVEGFRHNRLPVLSVQFHPEAAPGPLDSGSIFDRFLDMVK